MSSTNTVTNKFNCFKLQYKGEFIGRDSKYIISMIGLSKQHDFCIMRNYVKYKISTHTAVNKKDINIIADKPVSFDTLVNLLLELLRFENLFDGRFFPATSIIVDGTECLEELSKELLSYYNSNESYLLITLNFDNKRYKHYFTSWNKLNKKLGIIHQMYLYNTFVRGNSIDIRLSLLLEVFEALTPMLKKEGVITVPKNKKTISIMCKTCNKPATKQISQRPTFHDKLKAIINVYGKIIFQGDSKAKLLRKAVAIRNKIVHVNKEQKGSMSGSNCGVYLYKFALMYRYIIFLHLGIDESEFMPSIKNWLQHFNYKYDKYMLKP